VTFSLAAGDVLGVVGESGCGKSTLARLIMGLLPPTSGEVLVDGRSLASMGRRERARLIQPVFQDPFSSLNPRQRVRDIVGLPLAAQGDLSKAQQKDRVMEMLARVGMSSEMAERMPGQLSGGQRQRVAIARALVLIRASSCVMNRPARSTCPCRRRFSTCWRSCAASSG